MSKLRDHLDEFVLILAIAAVVGLTGVIVVLIH
jgi:hypothetical protein